LAFAHIALASDREQVLWRVHKEWRIAEAEARVRLHPAVFFPAAFEPARGRASMRVAEALEVQDEEH